MFVIAARMGRPGTGSVYPAQPGLASFPVGWYKTADAHIGHPPQLDRSLIPGL